MLDQGPLIEGRYHEDSLVVLQVNNLHTQETLNTASPNLLQIWEMLYKKEWNTCHCLFF